MVWPCPCPWARRLGNPFPTAVRATREQGWEGQMRRWIAGVLIMVLTMSSTAPVARAQSTPLIGGGLTALPTQSLGPNLVQNPGDRKSTRLNSSHLVISYAVFCLKKKKKA